MKTIYRGTMRSGLGGVRGSQSWSYSLPVAIIWSSRPGDIWSRRDPAFTEGSTVHVGKASAKNVLDLGGGSTFTSLASVLEALDYGKRRGITEEEVGRVLNYLHNRLTGRAKGGEFAHRLLDEDGDPIDENDLPLSFTNPQTLISTFREDWRYDPTLGTAERFIADTFIFADAPRVQEAAVRLGYDAFHYEDTFQGADTAARVLLGVKAIDLDGVDETDDIEDEPILAHLTYRPLTDAAVADVVSMPVQEAVELWRSTLGRAGQARGRIRSRSGRRTGRRSTRR